MQILTKKTVSIYWQHARRYPWHVLLLSVSVIVVTLSRDVPPIFYRQLVDVLAAGGEVWKQAMGLLVIILALNFSRNVFWRITDFVNNFFQYRVMADLMRTCYEYLQNHSTGFFNSSFVGSLVTKVKRYERSYEQLSDQVFLKLGRAIFEVAMIIAILAWRSWTLGGIMLAWAIFYIVMTYVIAMYKLPYDIKKARADTETTAQLADTITNNFNIKIFSNYIFEFKRYAKVIENQFRARKKSADIAVFGDIFRGISTFALEFILMYTALRFWQRGIITVGDIVLVQTFILRIFDQLWDVGKNIQVIYEAIADANEMTEILLEPHEVRDKANHELEVKKGAIEFNNVSFGYHKATEVLNEFNLKISPGERIALIGPSGGGKSTIVKLLLRFYDIDKGRILIDGQNIADITQDSLRNNIALVPQDPILFHRSLMENIRYAKRDATDEEVVRAAKLAHAHEFISKAQNGYDTYVGERGLKLSGGERQRVAIARAILKNAPILVFDEATSSLDSESEYLIQDALKNLMKGKTTIVIAHRLSTIMQMDRIVVIDGGRILEEGKHQELLKAKEGTYQRLWNIQAGGFVEA